MDLNFIVCQRNGLTNKFPRHLWDRMQNKQGWVPVVETFPEIASLREKKQVVAEPDPVVPTVPVLETTEEKPTVVKRGRKKNDK